MILPKLSLFESVLSGSPDFTQFQNLATREVLGVSFIGGRLRPRKTRKSHEKNDALAPSANGMKLFFNESVILLSNP
jgi:hypothetical protein